MAISSITVNALPTVSVTTSGSLICTGQSATLTVSGANTYSWNTASTNTSIVVSPVSNTTYTVTGTDANNCSNFSVITQSVSLCTGFVTSSGVETRDIKIYPNPSKDIFNVRCDCFDNSSSYRIYNALGQLMIEQKLFSITTQIDLSKYPAGLYYLKINTQNGEEITKLLKE